MKRVNSLFVPMIIGVSLVFSFAGVCVADKDLFQETIRYLLNRPPNGISEMDITEFTREDLEAMAKRKALDYGVDPYLVLALIEVESDFDPLALSHKGAVGLCQLMPETARSLGIENPWDVKQNIDGGVRYLEALIHEFDGDIVTALKAYNAGPGQIRRDRHRIPQETEKYIQKVARSYQKRSGKTLYENAR